MKMFISFSSITHSQLHLKQLKILPKALLRGDTPPADKEQEAVISKTVHQAIVILFYATTKHVEVRKFEFWERDSSVSNDDIRNAMRIFQRTAADMKCLFYDCKKNSKQPWRLKVKPSNQYCTTGPINWPTGLVPDDMPKSIFLKHVRASVLKKTIV